jgi:APA family basic amino acid/polyamine antiporter
MADDGCLPRWFRYSPHGPPRHSILLQTSLALTMLWTATFQSLLTYIGFTLGLCTAGTVVGLIRLRRRAGPQLEVPGWPWIPVIFVLSVLVMSALTIARKPGESAVGLVTLCIGWLACRLATSKRKFSA